MAAIVSRTVRTSGLIIPVHVLHTCIKRDVKKYRVIRISLNTRESHVFKHLRPTRKSKREFKTD